MLPFKSSSMPGGISSACRDTSLWTTDSSTEQVIVVGSLIRTVPPPCRTIAFCNAAPSLTVTTKGFGSARLSVASTHPTEANNKYATRTGNAITPTSN